MNTPQLLEIFQKTDGHCHFCGDPLIFEHRGKTKYDLPGYWEIDHLVQRAKGGKEDASNCLPACGQCNRLRWHRSGENIRHRLVLGVIGHEQVRQGTGLGKKLEQLKQRRLERNLKRRASIS